MKKLGKPVAETPTVLAPGEKSNKPGVPVGGTPISTVGGPAVPTKRVNFISFLFAFSIN